jgi:uncharacterized protein
MAERPASPGSAGGRAMVRTTGDTPGEICWADLAATDAQRAAEFYGALFGWRVHEERVGEGVFLRLACDGRSVASIYQLDGPARRAGVPSHWMPYVRVPAVDTAASRAAALGGRVMVRPFEVPGIARVGVIMDAVGAMLGLWESPAWP